MRKLSLLLVVLLTTTTIFSQERTCLTQEKHLESMQNPEIAKKRAAVLKRIEAFTKMQQNNSQFKVAPNGNTSNLEVDGNIYRIPIVFHVVHNGDALGTQENISDAQIMAQLQQLNDDFRRMNSDVGNTPAIFTGVAADTEIEFCLASVDPNGNATTGILRHQVTQASFDPDQNVLANQVQTPNAWPATSYLNFWSVNLTNGILGYAYYPGTAPSDAVDGVVILYTSIGSISTPFSGSGPYNLGRTATHEVGHWLNLAHIWGDGGCSVDDLVTDTPVAGAANYGCPTNASSCSSTDMVQNYMDYTDDSCMNLFTTGQKTRMRTAISASRAGLLTSSCGSIPLCDEAPPVVSNSSPLDLCNASSFVLSANAATSGFSHQWTLNGNDIVGATSQTYTANAEGTYAVYFTDLEDCTTSLSNDIVVNACNTGGGCLPVLVLDGGTTPSGTYEAETSVTSSVANQTNANINFYAGDFILLDVGFETPINTNFLAKIQDCTAVTGPLIDENFDNCVMPTGWTSYGITGTGSDGIDLVEFDLTESPGNGGYNQDPPSFSGCIATIDDDEPDSGDHETTCIETNAVNISTISNASLSLNWAFLEYAYGTGSQAFIEAFDGTTWNNLLTITQAGNSADDIEGPVGDADVFDLSSYNNTDFKVRFCYDDLGDWGWSLGIDNVVVE